MAIWRDVRSLCLTAFGTVLAITLPLAGCLAVHLYITSECTIKAGSNWPPQAIATFDLETLRNFEDKVKHGDDFIALMRSGKVIQIEPDTPARVVAFGSIASDDGAARQVMLGGGWHGKKVWLKAANVQMTYPAVP